MRRNSSVGLSPHPGQGTAHSDSDKSATGATASTHSLISVCSSDFLKQNSLVKCPSKDSQVNWALDRSPERSVCLKLLGKTIEP